MTRRTTVEIDEELLQRAQRALGLPTIRATIEEALRLTAASAETATSERAARQRRYLDRLPARIDVEVLVSDQMWR